jgi:DUF1680 family protein
VARLLASLPGYFYSVSEGAVWVHLYAEGEAAVELGGERTVGLRQRTRYPWDGAVEIEVQAESEFAVMVRVPAWCEEDASVEVNGVALGVRVLPGTYLEIRRTWRPGDTISMDLPMQVRRVEGHPYIAENEGRVALLRGPLLYCVEQVDIPDVDIRDLILDSAEPTARTEPDLLGGVVVLEAPARVSAPDDGWSDLLYRPVRSREEKSYAARVKAIPYYTWASREPGAMLVWLRNE